MMSSFDFADGDKDLRGMDDRANEVWVWMLKESDPGEEMAIFCIL